MLSLPAQQSVQNKGRQSVLNFENAAETVRNSPTNFVIEILFRSS